jgi:repressor LexA
MDPQEHLTTQQEKVLTFIQECVSSGRPPTIREIAHELGVSSTGTVRDYLYILERKGYIKRNPNQSRAIELTQSPLKIPIIGTIAAGKGTLAYESITGYVNPEDLFLGRISQSDVFALKVKGDSMTEAGIIDGDIAIVKKQHTADNGSIVAALLEHNEVTLKRLRQKDKTFFLEPANNHYQPIYASFSIIGKLLTIIRKY